MKTLAKFEEFFNESLVKSPVWWNAAEMLSRRIIKNTT